MDILKEFDLEIQPIKLARWQWLIKMMAENKEQGIIPYVRMGEGVITNVYY